MGANITRNIVCWVLLGVLYLGELPCVALAIFVLRRRVKVRWKRLTQFRGACKRALAEFGTKVIRTNRPMQGDNYPEPQVEQLLPDAIVNHVNPPVEDI